METSQPADLTLPERADNLEEARKHIFALDFSALKAMMADEAAGGLGWPAERLDYTEMQYKRWLFLRRKYQSKELPPSEEIDKFWHYHILDTKAYHRDTQVIFGYYLHHFPYFGMRGPADKADLLHAWEETQELYEKEFGEPIYEYEADADGEDT